MTVLECAPVLGEEQWLNYKENGWPTSHTFCRVANKLTAQHQCCIRCCTRCRFRTCGKLLQLSLEFYCRQNLVIYGCLKKFTCTISKTRASVLSGYPNTEKQLKARDRRPSAFIVWRCFDTLIKHEAQVLEITSHDHSQTNHKQRLPIRIVCHLTFLPG